ncbi:hypothetical protein C0992_012312 [Termitomyces sp. T32_za158]|nr:hypothetical protein C0992_012312 [Termitomyces sp. T32_za158]
MPGPGNRAANLRLTPISLAGSLLIISGTWLRLKCYHILCDLFTFEMSIRPNHRLITHGPYHYVRHPSYTGAMMVFIGMYCWYASHGSWTRESGVLGSVAGMALVMGVIVVILKATVGLLRRMPEEDRLLKAKFGKEWEDWARRVPWWLVPGVL